ncbi:MAG: glycosyltransferase family 2 protein [Cytophagia bacterium]|nr:glycosyltransferase family 2 protein [Cytophagia bacterium]
MTTNNHVEISVVTSLYNSSSHLVEFHERLIKEISQSYNSYELILVNDGSTDNTLEVALTLLINDANIRLIDLTRNFGQHQALMAGIKESRGKVVLLLACDLEEKPEWLTPFKQQMAHSKADVVYGRHLKKNETFLKKWSSSLFYKVFNHFSSVKLTPNIILFRLMNRAYVESLLKFNETVLFLPGIMAMAGHKQIPFAVDKGYKGSSSYDIKRLVHMAIDAITSFSTRPLTSLMAKGLIIFGLSFLVIVGLFVGYFMKVVLPFKYLFMLSSIWAACGLILSGMSIVGLYASRALIESKRRPQVIIRNIYSDK